MTWCVYSIVDTINQKVYVGKTKNYAARIASHVNHAHRGGQTLLCKAICDYGVENFVVNVLATFDSEQETIEAEKFWIETLQTHAFKHGRGYNMTTGGDGLSGFRHTESTKAKIRAALYNVKHTPERRANISRSQIGKKRSFSQSHLESLKKAVHNRKRTAEFDASVKLLSSQGFSKKEIAGKLRVSQKLIQRILNGSK